MIQLFTKSDILVPSVGLGSFPLQGREMADVVKECISVGYKLIDTSDDYNGEFGIGIACGELISEGVCNREDLFLQTKISNNDSYNDEPLRAIYFCENSPFMKRHSVHDIVMEKVETSLKDMKTDYLDSLLIHFPYEPYYITIWKELIKLKDEGIVRYIGVSNFHPKHIERLVKETGVRPTMNEIYLSPIGIKETQVQYAQKNNILLMTYSPLMDLTHNRFDSSVLDEICRKYNKSKAQLILRWNIQRGSIPLPKSSNPKRLKENIDVLDFNLTDDEIALISSLNKDYQYLPESKNCPGI